VKKRIHYAGISRTVDEWAELLNINPTTLRSRLNRGFDIEEAFLTPVNRSEEGNSKHPLYATYHMMRQRCHNPNATDYQNYGGRGIFVCDRWLNSFECFVKDVGKRPKGYTLERVNNSLGYSPSNVIWASPTRQSENKRNTVRLVYAGVTRTVKEWAELTGIDRKLILARIRDLKWDVEQALLTPVGDKRIG